MDLLVKWASPEILGCLGLLDLWGPQEFKGPLVLQGQLDLLVHRVTLELQDLLVRLDLEEYQGQLECKGPRGLQGRLGHPAEPVPRATLVHRAQLEIRARLDSRGLRDSRDRTDQQVELGLLVKVEIQGHLDPLDPGVRRAELDL